VRKRSATSSEGNFGSGSGVSRGDPLGVPIGRMGQVARLPSLDKLPSPGFIELTCHGRGVSLRAAPSARWVRSGAYVGVTTSIPGSAARHRNP